MRIFYLQKKIKNYKKNKKMEKYSVNKKEYLLEEYSHIEIQDELLDTKIYGWTLEFKSQYQYKNMESWFSSWTNRIYCSKQSALDAAIKIGNKEEFRISPLYKMEGGVLRDYKISQILEDSVSNKDNKKSKNVYEIKSWKLTEDFEMNLYGKHKKGSVFIQLEDGNIIKSGTSIEKTKRWLMTTFIPHAKQLGIIQEIEIKDEKWLHPHLLKELKLKYK